MAPKVLRKTSVVGLGHAGTKASSEITLVSCGGSSCCFGAQGCLRW